MEYIFLSGIHGVGKSTLVTKLQKEIEIKSFSVSDLIRKAGNNINISDKNTNGISRNQELWKTELNKIEQDGFILLLDGHFCLLDSDSNVTMLPFSTFEDTNMIKIILIKNKPQVIRERLLKRDNNEYSIDLLEEFQNSEIRQAIKYSEERHIELFIYDETEPFQELINFVRS
ncbi:ATP-binding protein [Bacillus thuringiensis]|uniref:ATP-binding protein n=1 Tax=Bacillus thuringiensis TaxID=1428 RepID=UPI0022266410|nr:ATP-binding protein [Bacillus thuringiensis]